MGLRRNKKTRRVKRKISRRRYRGGGYGKISQTVIQTSKEPIPAANLAKLKKQLDGWDYIFFLDVDILKFFQENPHDEFPDITNVFNSFTAGEHKADLFRYYYLYMKGGVFIDSDLMLYDSLSSIVGSNSFVSIWALQPEGSVFNGFLATAPNHPIIYTALKDAYKTKNRVLQNNYSLLCERLGNFVRSNMNTGVKMLKEVINNNRFCTIKDPDSEKISLIHYMSMDIPDEPPTV